VAKEGYWQARGGAAGVHRLEVGGRTAWQRRRAGGRCGPAGRGSESRGPWQLGCAQLGLNGAWAHCMQDMQQNNGEASNRALQRMQQKTPLGTEQAVPVNCRLASSTQSFPGLNVRMRYPHGTWAPDGTSTKGTTTLLHWLVTFTSRDPSTVQGACPSTSTTCAWRPAGASVRSHTLSWYDAPPGSGIHCDSWPKPPATLISRLLLPLWGSTVSTL
jgi:hypothetical protein